MKITLEIVLDGCSSSRQNGNQPAVRENEKTRWRSAALRRRSVFPRREEQFQTTSKIRSKQVINCLRGVFGVDFTHVVQSLPSYASFCAVVCVLRHPISTFVMGLKPHGLCSLLVSSLLSSCTILSLLSCSTGSMCLGHHTPTNNGNTVPGDSVPAPVLVK